MASLENLKAQTLQSLSNALTALKVMPDGTNGSDSAIRTLQRTTQDVNSINLPGYVAMRANGQNGGPVFFDPINKAIDDISGKSALNVPFDMAQIFKQQHVPQPDVSVLAAAAEVNKNLKAAKRSLQLMRNSWLRFLMGPWAIVSIFAFAILYAAFFFIFHGSDVPAPLTQDGARMVVEKASASVTDLKSTVGTADNVLDAISKFVEKSTKLISKLPALIAAFGVLYAACRKLVMR